MKIKKIFSIGILLVSSLIGFNSCKSNSYLFVNKTNFLYKEDINITCYADNNDAWVGIYRIDDDVNTTESIYWYYVNDNNHFSGETYSIQHYGNYNESRYVFKNLIAGDYKIIYFEKDYIQKEKIKIHIETNKLSKPSAPISASYTLTKGNGYADGTINLLFDKESFNATDIIMYWADDYGILDNYTSLAKQKINNYQCSIEMTQSTFIPQEATKLYIYASNNAGISNDYYILDLNENIQFNNDKQLLSSFQVVSDVHISINNSHLASSNAKELHDTHFKNMCQDIQNNASNSDALIINGDVANSGGENEWQHTIELLNQYDVHSTYYSIGNHDLYNGNYETQLSYFKKYANVNSVYYEKEINGFHHIFLGSESNSFSSVDAYLTDTQLSWFENKLESYSQENKPIFVYLHQSLYNTIAGSLPYQGWNGVNKDSELRNILSKYKNVLLFNGHSHWDLNSNRTMYTKDESLPNIFNTASVGYLWSSYYLNSGEYLEGSQGYYVEIYEDKILVLGRDFTNSKWIPSACFIAKI